jgi:hypothetical protein
VAGENIEIQVFKALKCSLRVGRPARQLEIAETHAAVEELSGIKKNSR